MQNTTSINDLPSDPLHSGNISLNIKDNINQNNNININDNLNLDDNTMNQFLYDLNNCGTNLPERDIPTNNTNQITQDNYIKPNYIPENNKSNYINYSNTNNYEQNNNNNNIQNNLGKYYDEFQEPLLIGILYFCFQLPIIKKTIYNNIQFLCKNDGNYNLFGLIFLSLLFSIIYYIINKFIFKSSNI